MIEHEILKYKTIAVVGCSTNPEKPPHHVPKYLKEQGYKIIPIHLSADEILGEKAYPSLIEVPGEIDVVLIFRPGEEATEIVKHAIEKGAKAVWMQEGIKNEEAAGLAKNAGLLVVMDKCIRCAHKERHVKEIDKGVCVQGFSAGGLKDGKNGIALILSDEEADCALMVTANRVKAAPLLVSAEHAGGKVRGIVANSGNANAYTGEEGINDARQTCELAAGELGLKAGEFIVASTGVIGRRMDMKFIETGIKEVAKTLGKSGEASLKAAEAIMTTDTTPKMVSVITTLNTGEKVEIGGICKGAGMIAPEFNHATMLCFLTTNAYVPEEKLKNVLESAVDQSFDMTVIDGDMSTNDMVVLLANGLAGNSDIDEHFTEALNHVTRELAKRIARDGEGATKSIEVEVKNAKSETDARRAARAVVSSNLVKTAIFGEDPNWGRIISALGYSGAEFNPEKVSLFIEKVCLVKDGKVLAYQDTEELKAAKKALASKEIKITADLNAGEYSACAYGCDMSPDYVRINAEYTT
ncbi:MAG: bifunctional ornithine acetyltransferase/N-acetylglutamate synthase [Candidatus Hydrothermarchaeaceae archaeon]